MKSDRRILLVDDTLSIHEDFRKILAARQPPDDGLAEDEALLFGTALRAPPTQFQIDSAYQGQEALQMVAGACERNEPYALAVVDMRMPPGWDGVETVERLWQVDDELRVVICTAYSDISWQELAQRLIFRNRLAVLNKPFDTTEALRLVDTLTASYPDRLTEPLS